MRLSTPLLLNYSAISKNTYQIVKSLFTTDRYSKSLNVVLRGIPTVITSDEVLQELVSLGFNVTLVKIFGSPKKPMPICMVTIKKDPASKYIFILSSLFYINIQVEAFKNSCPKLCFPVKDSATVQVTVTTLFDVSSAAANTQQKTTIKAQTKTSYAATVRETTQPIFAAAPFTRRQLHSKPRNQKLSSPKPLVNRLS